MTKKAAKIGRDRTGRQLEQRVAEAYRRMGARKVERDVLLAGNQIDVYVELGTPGRLLHRVAVEAKDWSDTVGIGVVNDFALRVRLLRAKGLIDRGVIISASGFSRQARKAAKDHDIRLFEPADLDVMISERREVQPPIPVYTPPPPPYPNTLPDHGRLPPGSRRPFLHNRIFTGRHEPLKALARFLLHLQAEECARPTIVTQVVQGMGGVGKTQLAVEFAYRYGRFFHSVHWLNAAQSNQIDDEIAACGEAMSLPRWPAKLPDQVACTLNEWRRGGPRLTILDNVEDVAIARKWLGRLNGIPLCVLITARRSVWPPDMGLNLLPLDVFTPEESCDFLRRHLPHKRATDADLEALAGRVGYLPLALELAGRYLAYHHHLAVDSYLEKLEPLTHPSMKGWWKEWGSPTDHNLELDATFALSWERVTHEAARRLFPLVGYCACNRPIPYELLRQASGLDSETLGEALGALLGRGLLKMAGRKTGPIVHPLLAEYARSIPCAERESSPLLSVAHALETLAQEANETGLPANFVPLRPHVEAVATAAEAAKLEQAIPLWGHLGDHLKTVADYTDAQKACERALAMAEQIYGTSHPQVAICANNLGDVLKEQGDLEGALDCLERALGIDKAHLGSDHPNIALDLKNIACILRDLGHLDRARTAFEQALEGFQRMLEMREDTLGPDHPEPARHIYSIGWIYKDLGDLVGARSCFSQALAINEATYSPDSPKIVCDLISMGLVLKDMGDWAGARTAFERALAIDETHFGPSHPNVARDLKSLGWLSKDLGEWAGARAAFELALAIYQAAYGKETPQVAEAYNDLGTTLLDLADSAGAREAFERALTIDEAVFGPYHPSVAHDVINLGRALKAQGNLEGAVECFKRALTIDETYSGPDHPNVARDIRNIGWILKDLGDLAGARYCFSRALVTNEAAFGPERSEVVHDLSDLGWVLKDQGREDEAVDCFKRALLIDQDTFGFNHPNVARGIRNVAWLLKDKSNGDLAGARYCFCRALQIDEAVFGPSHSGVVPDVRGLGHTLREMGDLEGALGCFTRTLAISKAHFGSDHPNVATDANNLGETLCDLGNLAGAREHFESALRIFEKTLPLGHLRVMAVRQNLTRTVGGMA